ncbi:MAG: hypothetical protein OEO77_02345 [Acidimicrobiia bacterium]|nr:hypothetical protein [Acidimicrobiia bacterium]
MASRTFERGIDRRSFLHRMTMSATALLVAPKQFMFEPVTAYAAICSCSGQACACGSLCCDGYTEFCCTMYGQNACPTGTIPAGWWKADGAGVCDTTSPQPRYYLDCNIATCGSCGCGSNGTCSGACQEGTDYVCGCGDANCANRKSACTQFRYGQCNQDVDCVGPIVCRVVTCTPPWLWDDSCTTTSATDNATRFHNRPCLADPTVLPAGIPLVGDWLGSGEISVGVFSNGLWSLLLPDGSVRQFRYGDAGDRPLVGDWNGNGIDTPGIYRAGQWHLRNSNTTGTSDISFWYGDSGDQPLVGDWNGNGIDTPGIYRAGQWHLRNSNTTGTSDISFWYGDSGDQPLVGDWNGNGIDTPGIYRAGQWHLRNSNTTGISDISFWYGDPGDTVIVGDWDGDGRDTPGIVRNQKWYLRNSATTGAADTVL